MPPSASATNVQGFSQLCHAQPGRISCCWWTPEWTSTCNCSIISGPLCLSAYDCPGWHMTLLHFMQQYTMPKETGSEPLKRTKKVIVIVRPYYSPDPQSPKYEQYCQQKLMLHVPFRHLCELLNGNTIFTAAYATSFSQAAFLHLWKMTSTDFNSRHSNSHRMMTLK